MINPARYGVSFSVKQCRNFGLNPVETLSWLIGQGWRRFRLMSYWDEHEPEPGRYDFAALDRQVEAITNAGGIITLCLGVKQPRWPEYHWPSWAGEHSKLERDTALLLYIETVVERYKANQTIVSWQLENEALLQGFGRQIEIDRRRLRSEFSLMRGLDPARPIAMSTSNGWGIPLRHPIPNRVGFSYYPIMYKNGAYHHTIQRPWLHRLRRSLVHQFLGKPVFIHELQCEPWGPTAIWKMSREEQDRSMSPEQIRSNIAAALSIKSYPIDLWGAEWWYWRTLQNDTTVIQAVLDAIAQ